MLINTNMRKSKVQKNDIVDQFNFTFKKHKNYFNINTSFPAAYLLFFT